LEAEKEKAFAAVKRSQDLEDSLNKFTERKDRELKETIDHHQNLFDEMKANLDAEIAVKVAEINQLVLQHQREIDSITTSKNEDITREKTIHEQTKQDLGGQISKLTSDLSSARTRIAVSSS